MRCPTLSQLPLPPQGKKGWPWTMESSQLPDTAANGDLWPKISIVTPSYNQDQFIEETIRSVLLQGYPNLEYIIVDGNSTDSTVEILKRYEKWLTFWVSEPDRGQSEAINKGFRKARGEIYTWLNSDDYLLENALKNIAEAFYIAPLAGAWCGACILVNEDSKTLNTHWPRNFDPDGIADWGNNHFAQPSCFFSEKAWQACGPLDEELHFEMDFALWLKIAKEFSINKVAEVLSAAHIHRESKFGKGRGPFLVEQFLIQRCYGYEHLAIRDINHLLAEQEKYKKLENILKLIYGFPLFRPILPIARIIWRKL